jgi:hypothetical protein
LLLATVSLVVACSPLVGLFLSTILAVDSS